MSISELTVRGHLLGATRSHFNSARARAKANLSVYLQSPAGIGDHSDLTAEVIRLVEALAAAEEGLKTLDDHFPL